MPDNDFVSIKIEGLDELIKKIEKLHDLDAIKPTLKEAAAHIKGTLDVYPPASEANAPGQKRWYQRNYGPRWTRKDGSWGGSKTSQKLNKSWTISEQHGGLTQIVGSNVKYGPFVMDEEHQASFHKARGWKTIQTVAREQTEKILQLVRNAIDKIIAQK